MRKRTIVAIALAIFWIAMAASSHVYLILESSGGTALWNANEAYLFIGVDLIGHRVNGLRFPWFLVENFIAGPEDQDDRRIYLAVIRVTPSAVERHVLKLDEREPWTGPDWYAPKRGRIYANYPALGGLCSWAGDHFEPATQEERRGFNGIDGLTEKDFDSGWYSRGFGVGPGYSRLTLTVETPDSSGLSVNSAEAAAWHSSLSINVLRPRHPPERIWNRGLRWGIVRPSEYRLAFQNPE
jgi:hypothetical protein